MAKQDKDDPPPGSRVDHVKDNKKTDKIVPPPAKKKPKKGNSAQ